MKKSIAQQIDEAVRACEYFDVVTMCSDCCVDSCSVRAYAGGTIFDAVACNEDAINANIVDELGNLFERGSYISAEFKEMHRCEWLFRELWYEFTNLNQVTIEYDYLESKISNPSHNTCCGVPIVEPYYMGMCQSCLDHEVLMNEADMEAPRQRYEPIPNDCSTEIPF